MKFIFFTVLILSAAFISACDSDDVWPGTTEEIDTVRPYVTASSQSGTTGWGVSSESFWIELSEPLNPLTVNQSTVMLLNSSNIPFTNIGISYSGSRITLTLPTSAPYISRNSSYTLFFSEGITDLAGNQLMQSFSRTISTSAGPYLPDGWQIHADSHLSDGTPCLVPGENIRVYLSEGVTIITSAMLSRIECTDSATDPIGGFTVFSDASAANGVLIFTVDPGATITAPDNNCTLTLSLNTGDVSAISDGAQNTSEVQTYAVAISQTPP